MSERIVCWFSHGAASAVATKLAMEVNNKSTSPKELLIVSIHLKNEHCDNIRFKDECEKWFGQEIVEITSKKYNGDVDSVIEKTRYMSGVAGARCTTELKKNVRKEWQRPDDIHVFGMTCEEENRIDQILDAEPELELWSPLIEKGYTKTDCFNVLHDAGIELPEMYKLGYHNNNCVGCLKAAGAGYWNKIREDFPIVFRRRSRQEKMLNTALVMIQANVYFNKHRDSAIENFEHFGRSIKFNGSGPIRKPNTLNNCIMVDKKLLDERFVSYDSDMVLLSNDVKGVNYPVVLIELSQLIIDNPDVLLTMLKDKETYPVVKVYLTRTRLPLRFLPEDAGSHRDLDTGSCGFFCEVKSDEQ